MTIVLRTENYIVKRGFLGWFNVYDDQGICAKFKDHVAAFNYVRTKEWRDRTKSIQD